MASPFLAGLAVAAAALAGRYGIQAWQSFKARPVTPVMRKFYEGGFQPTMTKREAALILGIREQLRLQKKRDQNGQPNLVQRGISFSTMRKDLNPHLDRRGVSFCTRTTYDDNAITNAIDIYDSSSGIVHFMASNNDCGIREFDMEKFQLLNHFRFPWPVNHTSMSPYRKLIAVVGDHLDALLGRSP